MHATLHVPMSNNFTRTSAAVLALLALVAASVLVSACGGGDDTGDDDPTATRAASTAAASPTRPASTPTEAAEATPTAPVAAPSEAAPNTVIPPTARPAATATPAPPPPPPPPPPGGTVSVAALDATAFTPSRVTAAAGGQVTLVFDNQDAGVLHDMTLFTPTGTKLAETDVFAGPAQRMLVFNPPGPGSYPFVCQVHPQDMRGTLVVQ